MRSFGVEVFVLGVSACSFVYPVIYVHYYASQQQLSMHAVQQRKHALNFLCFVVVLGVCVTR
eukprot:m.369989 g.369989  ORF g.369989 m.369989 type:complete len:62 (+) comp51759_c0_seq1:62-247(+)